MNKPNVNNKLPSQENANHLTGPECSCSDALSFEDRRALVSLFEILIEADKESRNENK